MKKLTVLRTALFALTVSAELWAQTRGPRYNPSRGSSGPSSSSGSSSRGPRYNPPSRPSSSSSSSTSTRGPRYNPPSSSSSSSSSSTYTPTRGPRYNPTPSTPSTPGPRYNPTPRAPSYHGPRVVVRGPRYHNPHSPNHNVIVYPAPRDYWLTIHRRHIYRRWIFSPVIFSYSNGYWAMGGYPYYVHNGYRHRYNPVEKCHYQLVDGDDYSVVKDFPVKECTAAYDECATERDTLNSPLGMERYFCAETVDEDLAVATTDEFSPLPVEMDDAKKAAIEAYLSGMTLHDLWKDGYKGGVGQCLIYKLRGNKDGCKWIVTVGDEYYPSTEGDICSASHTAARMGCDAGDEKDNVGCILKKAVQEGYCH